MLNFCAPSSFTGWMSPYRPTFSVAAPDSETALVRKIRSPQTIGLEWPSPGTSVFHSTFLPDSPFHSVGGFPALTPEAAAPRNWGQFRSAARPDKATAITTKFMHPV